VTAATGVRLRIDLAAAAVRPVTASLWRPAGLRERYLDYLYAMHAVVRASVPLMERAVARCHDLGSDPVAEPLSRYLSRHIEEERGHDDWLLADIAATGHDPAPALRAVPSSTIARLVGAQYYWLEHHHPVNLLGYIAVLEGNAPAPGLADYLAARTGFPDEAFRTVRGHAELDGRHTADLSALLDALPLTPAAGTALSVSALATAEALIRLLGQLDASPPTLRAAPATTVDASPPTKGTPT
jgi:hypothetical protein